MNLVDALVLKRLKGVGDGWVTKILNLCSQKGLTTLEELRDFGVSNLPFRKLPNSLTEFFTVSEFEVERLLVEDSLRDWADLGIKVLHLNSVHYPKSLLALEDPPPFLYCKGNLLLLENFRAIAVVGTRHNSSKGDLIATKTVEAFGSRDFIIISGLALGIDTIAHRAALVAGVPTVAVLVDLKKISPPSNKLLADEILVMGGLLVSENEPGTRAIGALFAKRDRIQAGLSSAVFAIETSKDGGTMHAVRAAGKMSRPVFVPDPVAAKYSDLTSKVIEGTQYLIESKAARPYTSGSYEQICDELVELVRSFETSPSKESQEILPL